MKNVKLILSDIINEIKYEDLPDEWTFYTLSSFSDSKSLFDYQSEALKSVIKTMFLYFQHYEDYLTDETSSATEKRKKKLYRKYSNLLSDIEKLDIKPAKKTDYLFDIYKEHFESNSEGNISFENFVNRLSLWMATASGKTLVIIKLFEILQSLINREEIPNHDILFLAPQDKIINQTIELAEEYSLYYKNKFIRFVSLKDYEKDKAELRLTSENEITVYYYRSDNIGDTSGEAILDYKNYLNNGKWYIVLDEAHKGSKESSKKQAYYTLMSANGFLFNLSATFTDAEDYVTNAYNFNLEKFIQSGYGKNIYVSDAEFNFVQSEEDRIRIDKQRIVLKSLLTLTACKLSSKRIRQVQNGMYHSPLGVTLTNTVTKENSDLHLYFEELRNFAEEKFDAQLFNEAKRDLTKEIKNKGTFIFDIPISKIDFNLIDNITPKDVLREVFNSEHWSAIEYLDSNDQKEIGLKLKSSTVPSPFALIRIGDIGEWKNTILSGFNYSGSFEVKNYFDNLNRNEDINILMGSRAFYEGWDSPRPNVLNCINIGKTEARKFILQAIGRGIRLEPVKNFRKRLEYLYKADKVDDEQYGAVSKYVGLIETLFIFATDEEMIQGVLTSLKEQETPEKGFIIELKENKEKQELLVPVYKEIKRAYENLPSFSINKSSLERLEKYLDTTPENVLMLQYYLNPEEIDLLKDYLSNEDNIRLDKSSNFSDLSFAINKLISLVRAKDKVFNGFRLMKEDIIHFLNVRATKEDYPHIQREVSKVSNFVEVSNENNSEKLMKELIAGRIAAKANYKDLDIKYLSKHYYYPMISSNDDKIEYINHVIKMESEVIFIEKLNKFLEAEEDMISKKYDWWMFSKLDESLDKVYIPYLDVDKLRSFKPDFVFWMKSGNDYRIVFVDPKGPSQSSFLNKVYGFIRHFEGKTFTHNGYNIKVDLILFNEKNVFNDPYVSKFWKSEVKDIFK